MKPQLRKILGLPDNTPIKFWLSYWKKSVKMYSDLNSYDIRLDNPHFLIDDILSEIEYNSFKNAENRQYFKSTLGKCMKEDNVFAALCQTQCKLAFSSWDASPLYIKTLCVDMLQRINDGYVKGIVGILAEMIDNSTSLDSDLKRKICKYTDYLISELIAQGVNAEDISSFIDEEQAFVDETGSVVYAHDIFHNIRKTDFSDEKEYYKSIEDFMEKRAAKDYMENLLQHYNMNAKDANVLVRVDGIKGKTNFKVQGVHFYSVDQKAYIEDKESLSGIEKPQADFEYVNIAVPVKHKYLNSSFEYARTKASEVLDYLSLDLNARKEISINKKIISLVINGRECGSSCDYTGDSSSSDFFKRLESLDLSNCQENLPLNSDMSLYHIGDKDLRKISNAVHWYNKTTKTERVEDILLYSWIAIESLLKCANSVQEAIIPNLKRRSTLSFIQEICSDVMLHNKFYSYAYDYYAYLISNTADFDNYFDIPKEIIEKADLGHAKAGKMIIKNFFEHVDSIKENVNSEILKYELEALLEFYTFEDAIKSYINNVKDDVLLVYRLRNLISHNATYSRPQTKLYGYKARLLCGNLIQAIRHHCKKYSISVEEAIVKIHTEHQMFMANIGQKMNDFRTV